MRSLVVVGFVIYTRDSFARLSLPVSLLDPFLRSEPFFTSNDLFLLSTVVLLSALVLGVAVALRCGAESETSLARSSANSSVVDVDVLPKHHHNITPPTDRKNSPPTPRPIAILIDEESPVVDVRAEEVVAAETDELDEEVCSSLGVRLSSVVANTGDGLELIEVVVGLADMDEASCWPRGERHESDSPFVTF